MTREEHLAVIKQADKAYYVADRPLLSDAAYDELRKSYIDTYGPEDLDYTPGAVAKEFMPFHHPVPVTSLAKIKAGETEKLHKWREKLSPVVLEPKYDGLTVVAYPQKDGSYKFVTRGSSKCYGSYEQEQVQIFCRELMKYIAFDDYVAYYESDW